MNTVPKKISAAILEFCKTLSPERPRYILSRPIKNAVSGACFQNVGKKIELDGGELCCGWAIWSIPNLYHEAEFHGVWRNQKGHLMDVSPQLNKVRKILFLPDFTASYDPNNFSNNIFAKAGNSLDSLTIVALAEERALLFQKYRNGEYLNLNFSLSDNIRLQKIQYEMREIILRHKQ